MNRNFTECYLDFPVNLMLLSSRIIQIYTIVLTIHYWEFYTLTSYVNFTEISFSVQCIDVWTIQLIQILRHRINASLLESCGYNNGLYKKVAFWCDISTIWRKLHNVCGFCKIVQEHSEFLVILLCPRNHAWPRAFIWERDCFYFS